MARYNLDYVFYSCFATEHKDIKPLNEYDTPGSVKAYEIESGETTEIMKFDIGSNAYVISSSPVVISKNTETKDLRCSTLYTYANGKLSKIMVAKKPDYVTGQGSGNHVVCNYKNGTGIQCTISNYDIASREISVIEDNINDRYWMGGVIAKISCNHIIYTKAQDEDMHRSKIFLYHIK